MLRKGKDLETTRRACERYRHTPVSILNFIEGTRFTREKHRKQQSLYRHLLRPKAVGFAHALAAMDGRIKDIIDVTIMYPKAPLDFWTYLCGKIPHIAGRIRKLPVPEDVLTGDYQNNQAFKDRFQSWVSGLWQEKDELIEAYRNGKDIRVSAE